uniref:Kinesin motor domain-containing protein n=1 Tax=Macrostomum lignano TaxID=282301 RepID=A0A1I8FD00_9PLAT
CTCEFAQLTPNEQLSCTACARPGTSAAPTAAASPQTPLTGWLVADRSPSTLQSQQANAGLDESNYRILLSKRGGGGGGERVSNRFTFSGVFDETADQQGLTARAGTPQSPACCRAPSPTFSGALTVSLSGAEQLLPFPAGQLQAEAAPLAPDEARAALAETRAVAESLPADAADTAAAGKVGSRCSVWVSCAEIYNEIVYDLLEPLSRRAPSRTALELRADRTGSVYVKGLRSACRLRCSGKHNQHLAATKLNQQSSGVTRCSPSGWCAALTDASPRFSQNPSAPAVPQVSSLTFCDLAGSERRQRHAGTAGERTREAGSINSSLLTLRRCRNQRNPRASMLVPAGAVRRETFNALKFSSLARSVIVSEPTPKRLRLAAAATASPGYGVASKSAASGGAGGGVRTGRRQDGEQRLADEDDELEAFWM